MSHDSDYVCPQCGPAPEGPDAHAETMHTWRPRTATEAWVEDAKAVAMTAALDLYVASVRKAWNLQWKGTDHRYGRDFAAFLGERLLTDFDLRRYEPGAGS